MLQLFNTGINCFITRFRWPTVVVLPVVSKPRITPGLLIDGMAETTDPAFAKDIRVYPAFQKNTSNHHARSMLLIEISLEFFRKMDCILRNTLYVAVLEQLCNLLWSKRVFMSFLQSDPILPVSLMIGYSLPQKTAQRCPPNGVSP